MTQKFDSYKMTVAYSIKMNLRLVSNQYMTVKKVLAKRCHLQTVVKVRDVFKEARKGF